jgi:hypothetical protein
MSDASHALLGEHAQGAVEDLGAAVGHLPLLL